MLLCGRHSRCLPLFTNFLEGSVWRKRKNNRQKEQKPDYLAGKVQHNKAIKPLIYVLYGIHFAANKNRYAKTVTAQ